MNVSINFIKNLSTLLFLSFLMIVAIHIPTSALLNNPIFHNDETSYFHLNNTNLSIYRSQGFIISNIQNRSVIVPENKNISSSLYDLYLGFEQNDFTNNYVAIKTKYTTNILQKQKGNHSAKFISHDDSIILFPNNNSILKNKSSGLQNFTISFHLYPYLLGEGNQTIVKYEGYYNDQVTGSQNFGFSIAIKNGTIHYDFNNFFTDSNGDYYSFTLTETMPLVDRKWEKHTIVVDTSSSVIKAYRNDVEEDIVLIRKQQNSTSTKLYPSPLLDGSQDIPLTIGKNSFFSLDEFSIYRDAIPNNINNTTNKMHFFETQVFNISQNISQLYQMDIDSSDTNVHLKLAYRIDDKYFLPNTSKTNLPWVYIDPQKKQFPPSYSKGTYLQWRVEYFEPATSKTYRPDFFIRDIFAKYKETSNPGTISINYITAKDNSVEISWQTLPNDIIQSYEIYYGNQPNNYFGKATVSPNSPINIDISPSSISKTMTYVLEGLENEQPYYISIRAKDIYGQYGSFSPEIISKPSSINNEFGYSINR